MAAVGQRHAADVRGGGDRRRQQCEIGLDAGEEQVFIALVEGEYGFQLLEGKATHAAMNRGAPAREEAEVDANAHQRARRATTAATAPAPGSPLSR